MRLPFFGMLLPAALFAATACGDGVALTGANGDGPPLEGVLVGAGDIANCDLESDTATAALLDDVGGMVFTAGDHAYNDGTPAEFENCYDPTWGRHRARTRPAPGNHDYFTPGAAGYFGYFGDRAGPAGRGYYSYDLGSWHIVSLNSNVEVGPDSPQAEWLRDDLESNPTLCALAYWHHARFSSGEHGDTERMRHLWGILDEAGADVVINAHDHDYERFAPQDADGVADPNGIRAFVVGTGGDTLSTFVAIKPNSQVRNSSSHGVLKVELFPGRYEWEFLAVPGSGFSDRGVATCDP